MTLRMPRRKVWPPSMSSAAPVMCRRPAAGPNPCRDTVLAAEEDTGKIDSEDLLPMIGRRFDERLDATAYPRVVEQHVDLLEVHLSGRYRAGH
jgi:hypothetical protein